MQLVAGGEIHDKDKRSNARWSLFVCVVSYGLGFLVFVEVHQASQSCDLVLF